MKDTALFIGWGGTYPGREQEAVAIFRKSIEVFEQLKADGEIEDFEPVLLAPHGDLDGFLLVHGEQEKLAQLMTRDDLHHMQLVASCHHPKFSVVWAETGDRVLKEMELLEEIAAEPVHA